MMIFDHLSHAKNHSILLTNWRSCDYQTCHKKQNQKRLAKKKWFVKEISVLTKNVQQRFGFTEVNEKKFSETLLVKTSLPLTQFLSNTKLSVFKAYLS